MKKKTEQDIFEARDVLVELVMKAEQEAGNRGFFKTMHKLNEAKSQLGWELAEELEKIADHAGTGS